VPELPEVETVRRTLAPAIGARITTAWDSGMGLHMKRVRPRGKRRRLVGGTITEIRRLGKYLLVDVGADRSLLVHLGMTGRLRIQRAADPRAPHTHVVLGLGDRELRFSDPRRFGQVDVVDRAAERSHPALAVLGPDPLVEGIDVAAFHGRAQTRQWSPNVFLPCHSVNPGVGHDRTSKRA